MQLYLWRHSKHFSSWSMLDEPHIWKENYLQADVTVLAESKEAALQLLDQSGSWNVEDLRRIEPEVITLNEPRIVLSHVDGR
ncbi:MAG: hypothetical protein RBT36_00645 [Desulfobulbus sp.]|jgi:hypothetical protein|nr:hypothetical protein [Desulfobulbus sp.]